MRIDGRAPMVHSVLTPASTATSRQCSPGTRRLPWRGTPAFSGVTFARREARNSRTSFRFSIRETVVGRTGPLGAPDSTPSRLVTAYDGDRSTRSREKDRRRRSESAR